MQRYKHIYKSLEKELNNKLLSKGLSKIPVQNVMLVDDLYKKLSEPYRSMYSDYVAFYKTNGYRSEFVNDMMFEVIAEKRKIQKFIRNNKNLQELKELIPDLHMVGGCIRDIINGIEPKDIDLCTSLSYDEVHKRIQHLPNKDVGKHFLVNIVELNDEKYEIATFRKDKYSISNDMSVTQCGDIKSDAQRR